MRITADLVVPEGTDELDARIKVCAKCGVPTWFTPQTVMVLSASGARSMVLWTCEEHPLPQAVTDLPEEES